MLRMPVSKRTRAIRKMTKTLRRARAIPRAAAAMLVQNARRGVKRSIVGPSRNNHSFRRWTNEVRHSITGTTGSVGYSCTFADIRGYTDFTDLYDRYMITCVVLRFRLVNNPNCATSLNNLDSAYPANNLTWNTTNWFPAMYYCKDYDDAAAETLEQLKERANCKRIILQPNKMYKIVLRPAVTIQTYATSTTTGYAPKWRNWIDMAQTDVPHYGLKYVIDCSAKDPVDTQPFLVERSTQIYFKCKDVR